MRLRRLLARTGGGRGEDAGNTVDWDSGAKCGVIADGRSISGATPALGARRLGAGGCGADAEAEAGVGAGAEAGRGAG